MKTPVTSRRRRRSAKQWAELVAAASSASSEVAFCEQQDISAASLRLWQRRLRKQRLSTGQAKSFIPVHITQAQEPGHKASSALHVIEIVLRCGRIVRVIGEVNTNQLGQVLAVAEQGAMK